MYIWTWSRKKIAIFWPGNLNKSSWSSGVAERQIRQSYREALVQISSTTEKKKEKETGRALERVVGEWEGKTEKEQGRRVTILESTHTGPYGLKNFEVNNFFAFL